VLAEVVQRHDVRVLQSCDRLGLGQEAGEAVRPGVGARQHHLQRYHPVQLEVPCPVDDAHAAPAQFAQDLVAGHRRPGRGSRRQASLLPERKCARVGTIGPGSVVGLLGPGGGIGKRRRGHGSPGNRTTMRMAGSRSRSCKYSRAPAPPLPPGRPGLVQDPGGPPWGCRPCTSTPGSRRGPWPGRAGRPPATGTWGTPAPPGPCTAPVTAAPGSAPTTAQYGRAPPALGRAGQGQGSPGPRGNSDAAVSRDVGAPGAVLPPGRYGGRTVPLPTAHGVEAFGGP
jgi:hypothetical protein